jgi:hypothetical protein
MRKFWSLLKREWHLYKIWPFISLLVGVGFIGILPIFEYRFNTSFTEEELRFQIMIIVFFFLGAVMPFQFLFSIRRDIRTKELWLHNSSSILVLIGVKLVYTLLWVTMMSFLYTIPFYFLEEIIRGAMIRIFLLQLLIMSILFVLCILTAGIVLPFYALYLQLKRYISYGSLLVTGVLFGAFLYGVNKVSTSLLYEKLLYHGEVPLNAIGKNMPDFANGAFLVVGNMYIVEELVMWLLLITCFIAASKWIERVITR